MSDRSLDIEEQIERIRRARNESDKFVAEQRKLMSEAAKLDRDRIIAPWQLAVVTVGSMIGGISGLFAAAIAALHAVGVH